MFSDDVRDLQAPLSKPVLYRNNLIEFVVEECSQMMVDLAGFSLRVLTNSGI